MSEVASEKVDKRTAGYKAGLADGYDEGYAEGRRSAEEASGFDALDAQVVADEAAYQNGYAAGLEAGKPKASLFDAVRQEARRGGDRHTFLIRTREIESEYAAGLSQADRLLLEAENSRARVRKRRDAERRGTPVVLGRRPPHVSYPDA